MTLYVWRSARRKGDTKTTRSRRSLQLPDRCVDVLRALWDAQHAELAQGATWDSDTLVFRTQTGTPLAAGMPPAVRSGHSKRAASWCRFRAAGGPLRPASQVQMGIDDLGLFGEF
jgi:hypothetical protein